MRIGNNAFNCVGKARDLVDVVCDPGDLTDDPELSLLALCWLCDIILAVHNDCPPLADVV